MSQIFTPLRTVGSIVGDKPVSFTLLYEKPCLMVPIGRTYHIHGGLELQLLRGGPTFECEVTAVSHSSKYRFAAEGGQVHAFSHHKHMWTKPHSQLGAEVTLLHAMDAIVFSVGSDNKVVVFEYRTGEALYTLLVPQHYGQVTSLVLPRGYTNKVLLGTAGGFLLLYNFRTETLLFSTNQIEAKGVDASRITSLTVHPFYKDICAVGTGEGKVLVYHFGEDRPLATFKHQSGSVTSVEFRKDEDGHLYSGTSLGEVALWSLEKMTLAGILTKSKQVRSREDVLDNAHKSHVHSLVAFPGHPLMLSCGGDNAMRQYRLDTVDGMALMVRERCAHQGACASATFFNTDLILTGGEDQCFRCTHVFSDRASWEMSQGKLGKRARDQHVKRSDLQLAPIIKMASSPARNYQWSSVVSIHRSSNDVVGWRLDNRVVELRANPVKTGVHCCRSVAVSLCGNYAVVGYSSGHLTRLNLQDKEPKHFMRLNKATGKMRPAHDGSVEEVCIAAMNSLVVSVSQDETVRTWKMNNCSMQREIRVGLGLAGAVLHPHASLVGANCADFAIRFYDLKADRADFGKVVRQFDGHAAPISAMAITPDTWRHVVSASTDCVLFIWDMASGSCVGGYRMLAPVQSLAFHPDALMMLTTHVGEQGAYLWTNNLRYGFAPNVVDTTHAMADPASLPLLHFPHSQDKQTSEEEEEAKEFGETGLDVDEADVDLFDAKQDIARMKKEMEMERREKQELDAIKVEGLHRTSRSQQEFSAIEFLDQIKEKNQPLLPPKKEKAPFFLETTKEVNPTFIVKPSSGKDDKNSGADFFHGVPQDTDFKLAIKRNWTHDKTNGAEDKFQFTSEAIEILSAMSIHELDLELRRLIVTTEDALDDPAVVQVQLTHDVETFQEIVQFLTDALELQGHTDLVQCVLGHVLQLHAVILLGIADKAPEQEAKQIQESMAQLLVAQGKLRERISHLVDYPLCLSSTFSNAFS